MAVFAFALVALFAFTPQTPAQEQAAAPVAAVVDLDQGWSQDDQQRWYGASQGSRLIPLAWFRALEQADSERLFLDDANIEALRYLPRPGQLPVGFAIDVRDDRRLSDTRLRWRAGQSSREPWVGFNCSACHTAQVTYRSSTLRVDGGPSLADFQTFIESFNWALNRTRDDPAKFERFATRLFGGPDQPNARRNRDMLRRSFSQLVDYQNAIAAMNETPLRYGHARLDAIGYILNKVSFTAQRNGPTANAPDAPVSYPFIWNTAQHRFVQWNGVAENKPIGGRSAQTFDAGALGRNVGEVIGVFADVRPRAFMQTGARSSVDVANLVALEQQLARLRPPRWPAEVLGTPDPTLVSRGRVLFGERCANCHAPLQRTDLTTRPIERMVPFTAQDFSADHPGTDIWMACNTVVNEANTGALRGQNTRLLVGRELGRIEPVSEMLRVLVTQTVAGQADAVSRSAVASFLGNHQRPLVAGEDGAIASTQPGVTPRRPGQYSIEERRQRCINALDDPDLAESLAYKARPLVGIWATAPYLHNGSVASLYELLLPPEERSWSFNVGTREYDPVRVGYVTAASADNPFRFSARDEQGGIIEGNSNLGHDYGNASLTPGDRQALVEYLKVIGE